MWNKKRPSSFIVNKLRGEIKDVSFPWFLFYYQCSSMQLIFETVCKPCTQVVHFSIQSHINNYSVRKYIGNLTYHCARKWIIFSHRYLCVCVFTHSLPKIHANKHRYTCLIGAIIRTFLCSSLQGAMKIEIHPSHLDCHVVLHMYV